MTTQKPTTVLELESALAGYSGTEHYYRTTFGGMKYTDGVKGMADAVGGYWLIDAIASYQGGRHKGVIPFQLWRLDVKDGKAVLTMREDSDRPALVTQRIPFTDFPTGTFELYAIDGVILLKGEY